MKPIFQAAAAKLMFPLVLMSSLALLAPAASAEIYKWVDDNNQTQYSQMPPPTGVAAVRIESHASTPDTTQDTGSNLQDRLEASEEHRKKAEQEAARAEKKAEIERIIEQNCAAARNNLEQLNRGGQIRYRDSNGHVMRMSEEDRVLRIEEARTQIKEFCKG